MRLLRMLCAASILGITPALAAAPQGILDKTVTLTWSTSGTGKRADGTAVSFSNVNTRIVYISSAGRPFLRKQVRGRKASRQGDVAPDQGGSGGSVNVQGNTLVGTETFMSGARQYRATFDAGFSSCSLQVLDAKAGGANIKRKGPDGAMYEITSVSTGSPSCSIQSGNAFAH
jgi:hypothetical protein